jgi:hypothetical protein
MRFMKRIIDSPYPGKGLRFAGGFRFLFPRLFWEIKKLKYMELMSHNVTEVLKKCLYESGEDTTGHVKCEGVQLKIGFDPKRLELERDNIESMLSQLPKEFKKEFGGGMSFLNACVTEDGVQWGEHRNVDELLCLGQAIGKVAFPFPRDMWNALPGGMPYVVVN